MKIDKFLLAFFENAFSLRITRLARNRKGYREQLIDFLERNAQLIWGGDNEILPKFYFIKAIK